ncbi:hypothetical protein KV102_18355 [Mumia sp. zg.B53]|uniref:DUF6891 domain-containing protein n=1 Tax=unclassified Mumia TaxID=2621872 RepID=UPI001C6F366C|nr:MULTISPECIES: hypothetical protein [unclassified Mumia]MBW9206073.1 hypothetical protein [Mumia sp. zg.B17]MBW9211645.1 hypothetical protein [Mumia sp. zg.B21]MBW9216805.1 hypothetical protein [Mumia sp. zg.B53]MDD9349248.1 hypothetical protein [Mumia sp.]
MPFFSAPRLTDADALRSYARVLVRAGLTERAACVTEVEIAAREDAGLVDTKARTEAQRLVDDERAALAEEQSGWPARTDYDALQEAFQALEAAGFVVLQGVDDHWAAAGVVREAAGGATGSALRGIVWFTPSDVWHAVDHGMLEVNVWHPDSANIADGDPLCSAVVATLDAAGLAAHFDEGRIEVRAFWHRRLTDA